MYKVIDEAYSGILLSKSMKFIGRISTMGEKKVVIYVPQEYYKEILQNFKGKALKITIEEAI
jgi:hypothetical protein